MMGRVAEPVEKHHRSGQYREDRHGETARNEATKRIKPPKWLRGPSLAAWQLYVPEICDRYSLERGDVLRFAVICQAYERWREIEISVGNEPGEHPLDAFLRKDSELGNRGGVDEVWFGLSVGFRRSDGDDQWEWFELSGEGE